MGSKPGKDANGYKHGMFGTLEYNSWQGMKARCHNPKNPAYEDYGGRGIVVCERWRESFKNFYEDMGPAPGPEYSVDRFPDVDGNYEPSNCRWATRVEQNNNTRRNVFVEYQGEKFTFSQLARKVGLNVFTLAHRLESGMSVEEAVKTPLKQEKLYEYKGESKTLRQWSDVLQLPYNVLYQRIEQKGWSVE